MIKTVLYALHGVLFTLTILAGVVLDPIIVPIDTLDNAWPHSAFGLLTATGVLMSWLLTYGHLDAKYDADGFVADVFLYNVVAPTIHAGIVTALLWAWITYIPLLQA